MLPLRDENPSILTPVVTLALIAVNVLAWLEVQGLGDEAAVQSSVCRFGLIPARLFEDLSPSGVMPVGVCRGFAGQGWSTLMSSMFLHGSFAHLLGNMWFLWIFGNNVEDSMGHTRFVAFYLLCGLAAAVAQLATDPQSTVPMVGASGAIGGVMGAYVVLYPFVRVHMLIFFPFTVAIPAVWMLGYWFVIQLLSGLSSLGFGGGGVAFWAHVGGFAAGAILIPLFRDWNLVRRHPYHGWTGTRGRSSDWL